jgi:hypothetical protein
VKCPENAGQSTSSFAAEAILTLNLLELVELTARTAAAISTHFACFILIVFGQRKLTTKA